MNELFLNLGAIVEENRIRDKMNKSVSSTLNYYTLLYV